MEAGKFTGYRLTPKAEDDLEAIWRYSAGIWSTDQADPYIDTLIRTIKNIVALPTIARERLEFDPPVRIHPSAEHLIIYYIDADTIHIVRVLGGRQNWRALLEVIDT